MLHRGDEAFSAVIHRVDCLARMVCSGRGLRVRDELFLREAEVRFPPTKKDSCMKFHIDQVWRLQGMYLKGLFL